MFYESRLRISCVVEDFCWKVVSFFVFRFILLEVPIAKKNFRLDDRSYSVEKMLADLLNDV